MKCEQCGDDSDTEVCQSCKECSSQWDVIIGVLAVATLWASLASLAFFC